MDYKSLMGYGKKKKVIKEQSKPKKTVLDGIKQELDESALALGMQTLKDNPPFQIKEVGAAPVYKKHIKEYQDFPIAGVTYYDLNPIYENPAVRNLLVKDIYDQIKEGIEEDWNRIFSPQAAAKRILDKLK